MFKATVKQGATSRTFMSALAVFAIAWSHAALAVSVPVLYVSVDAAPEVSFENDQVCEGTKAVICLGTGAVGDLLISSFELRADPDPYVTAAMNVYNASLTNTLSVEATVLFPMAGSFTSPTIGLGTGFINNVFGGGIFNVAVEGLVDASAPAVALIDEVSPGVPLTVCEQLSFDPACQGVTSVSLTQPGASLFDVVTYIGLRLTFDISPDTVATIGFDPGYDYDGAAYFSATPQSAVPVPGAVWMLGSGIGALLTLRRRAQR
jgi:hypothetical protein